MSRLLSKDDLKRLKVGQSITGEGLEVRRTSNGLAYYASTQVHGVRRRDRLGGVPEGMNLTKARKELMKLRLSATQTVDPTVSKPAITFKDAAAYYIQASSQSGGKNLRQKEQQLSMHIVPYFGTMKIKSIGTLNVEKYAHSRREAGAAVSTVNRELSTIRHMLNQLSDWGVVEASHIKVKTKSGENRRDGTFSEEQIKRMLSCAANDHDPYTHLFILIGFLTSMRHGEILRIKFEHFDFDGNRLRIPAAKSGSRSAPVHDSLIRVIKAEQERRGVASGFVFAADTKTGHRTYMKKQFRRVLVAAGLEDSGLTPHSMRHTAISIVMRSQVSVADAMVISGHKTPQMLLHYTHHNNKSVARGVDSLAAAVSPDDVETAFHGRTERRV